MLSHQITAPPLFYTVCIRPVLYKDGRIQKTKDHPRLSFKKSQAQILYMVVESLVLYKLSPLFSSFLWTFQQKRSSLVLIDNDFLIHDKLQVVSKELVHLADAGGNAEVNGSVADLDD